MREDYEASFDSTDTLDTRDIAIRVSNPGQGVEEKTENIVEASEDLLSGVLGDLEKKEDHAEDEKTDDQSKTLLPGCFLVIEKEEISSEKYTHGRGG